MSVALVGTRRHLLFASLSVLVLTQTHTLTLGKVTCRVPLRPAYCEIKRHCWLFLPSLLSLIKLCLCIHMGSVGNCEQLAGMLLNIGPQLFWQPLVGIISDSLGHLGTLWSLTHE